MAKKIEVEKADVLWKDRRRRLGLPLSFTRYIMHEDRLILKLGFFNTTTDEILLYRVMDIRLSQSLWQKIFGVGSVTVVSTDESHPALEIKSVRQPDRVRMLLSKRVETEREDKGISSREFLGGLEDTDGLEL